MICKFIFFRNQSSLITMREKELTIRPTDQLLRHTTMATNFPFHGENLQPLLIIISLKFFDFFESQAGNINNIIQWISF